MTRRNRIIIWIGIIIGLLLASILFYLYLSNRGTGFVPAFVNRQQAADQQQTAPAITPEPTDAPAPTVQPPAPTPPANPEDQYLKQLARIFVERFGSYSNQNNNQHITDVLPLATQSMAQYLQTRRMDQGKVYTGSTTRVITSSLRERDANSATVDLRVQQELKTSQSSSRSYKEGYVSLVREGTDWKVSGVFWKET